MSNPYDDAVINHPAYGRCHAKVAELLPQASLDPDEKPVSAVRCGHGQGHLGHLVLTTHRIRWIETFPWKRHDFWALTEGVVLHRLFPAVLLIPASGDLFQGRGLNPRPYKEFAGLSQLMVEAMLWEAEHTAPEPVPVVVQGAAGSLSDELERLANQAERGLLSPAEFETAKQRLLSA